MQLKSQLPSEPIEDPESWAWGEHPNGLGYKVIIGIYRVVYTPVPTRYLSKYTRIKFGVFRMMYIKEVLGFKFILFFLIL